MPKETFSSTPSETDKTQDENFKREWSAYKSSAGNDGTSLGFQKFVAAKRSALGGTTGSSTTGTSRAPATDTANALATDTASAAAAQAVIPGSSNARALGLEPPLPSFTGYGSEALYSNPYETYQDKPSQNSRG